LFSTKVQKVRIDSVVAQGFPGRTKVSHLVLPGQVECSEPLGGQVIYNFVEQVTAVTLLVDFFLGVTCGVVGGAVRGSLREDKRKTLLRRAPGPVSDGARVLFGVYTRDDGYMASLLSGGDLVLGTQDERQSDDSGAERKDPER
jgi:hypothetical protein